MKQIQTKVSGSMSLFLEDKFVYRHMVNVPAGFDFLFSHVLSSLHVLYNSIFGGLIMISHYGLQISPRFDGDCPYGCVSFFYGWIIRASLIFKGFEVYKNSFASVYRFSDLKYARSFIINQFNKSINFFNF